MVEERDEEVYNTTPLEPALPWWKQRQSQLLLGTVFILLAALAVALGVLFKPTLDPPNNEVNFDTNSILSSPTEATSCPEHSNCGATLDTWMDIGGCSISDLMKTIDSGSAPNKTERLGTLLEGPIDSANYYGARMKGWLVPPVTGVYMFWIAIDDLGEFWLSKDDNPANRVLICDVRKAVGAREWEMHPEQESLPILFVAGQSYYFEVRSG